MPLPPSLTARLGEDLFWAEVLDEDVKQELDFAVDVGDDYRIGTQILLGGGAIQSLEIYPPGSATGRTIGYLDEAHPMPATLRWEELELICRASALLDPDIRHPGPVAALLVPYLLRDGSESLDAISPVLDAAFRQVRPRPGDGLRPETRTLLERPPLPGITWVTRPDGHLAVTAERDPKKGFLHSYRTPETTTFPFDVLSGLLDAAEATATQVAAAAPLTDIAVRSALDAAIRDQDTAPLADAFRHTGYGNEVVLRALESPTDPVETAWVLEVLSGTAQGTIITRWFGASPLHHLHRWDLELRLVTTNGEQRPTAPIRTHLKRLVRSGVLTHVDAYGGTTYPDGRDETRLHVVVRDDLPAAAAAIREVLAQAPPGVTASLWNDTEEISLSTEQ
ncbi:hypothetical protein [Pseudofrankia saprophytica]|uniref:hypothetical protein n=1 Tax=Pseudofrankia saprophytica TaxID=298655 RepID=UPI000234B9FB|nr:hypothetical protein [Pseudofrankia saprophytica]